MQTMWQVGTLSVKRRAETLTDEPGSSESLAFDDRQRCSSPTSTLQSHRGLEDYHEVDTIGYSTGNQFVGHTAPLLPTANNSPEQISPAMSTPVSASVALAARQPPRSKYALLETPTPIWQLCALVDQHGLAHIMRYPTKKHNSTPTVGAPLHMVKGLSFKQRLLPLAQQVTTARPQQPDPPPEWLAQEVVHNLKSWEDCVYQRARLRL